MTVDPRARAASRGGAGARPASSPPRGGGSSWSWIVNLPDGERTRFLAQLRELIGDQRELRLRYRTEVHWARRL